MIERKFISEKVREVKIKAFLKETFSKCAYSHSEIQKTPLGMRVVIHTSKPGLVVGSGGANIRATNEVLSKKFNLENPQVDVEEVKKPELDAQIMSERVAFQLQKWGVQRFKKIGYSAQESIMKAGAKGVEISIAGKVPGKRATTWPFRAGYLPRTGYVSDYLVNEGFTLAKLKPGVVGITVRILRADVKMPDEIIYYTKEKTGLIEAPKQEEVKEEKKEEKAEEKKTKKTDKKTSKKTASKKKSKKEESVVEEVKEDVEEVVKTVKKEVDKAVKAVKKTVKAVKEEVEEALKEEKKQ